MQKCAKVMVFNVLFCCAIASASAIRRAYNGNSDPSKGLFNPFDFSHDSFDSFDSDDDNASAFPSLPKNKKEALARRNLGLKFFANLPKSCVVFGGCETFDVNNPPDVSTNDFDETLAFDLVDWYCCALKVDSTEDLHEVANYFNNKICGSSYISYLLSKDVDDVSVPEKSILHYCPGIEGKEHVHHCRTWSDLWSVAGLSKKNRSPYLSCPSDSRTGTDHVTFIITPYAQTLYEDHIIPHVYVKQGESIFGWMPEEMATDDFMSVTGGAGKFHVMNADDFQISEDTFVLELDNFDASSMMQQYAQIKEEGIYDLIDHNCAHVGLKLLAAGLGCQANIIPFFTPTMMQSFLVNLKKQNEEGLGERLWKVNRALRLALNALLD